MWNRKVFIRVVEVLLCIACVTTLRITDDESRRVYHFLRNRSREWSLLNNITWGVIGAALATATCGGYLIITAGLLIGVASGELRGRITEGFFLILGIVLFSIIGVLSLFSIDSIPSELFDNAIIFGVLCLATALVFVIDWLMSPVSHGKSVHDSTQTFIDKEAAKQSLSRMTTVTTISDKQEPRVTLAEEAPFAERERRVRRSELQATANSNKSTMTREGDFVDSAAKRASGYFYRAEDVYHRPAEEVEDVPPFPTDFREPIFSKVVNPGVKIMRVERDDSYRYSDASQYDNVPMRLRGGSSPGNSRRQRNEYFSDRNHSLGSRLSSSHRDRDRDRDRDRLDRLEECLDALKYSTTSTQTALDGQSKMIPRIVPHPTNEPGYVRRTASNWPQTFKNNAPHASPEHEI